MDNSSSAIWRRAATFVHVLFHSMEPVETLSPEKRSAKEWHEGQVFMEHQDFYFQSLTVWWWIVLFFTKSHIPSLSQVINSGWQLVRIKSVEKRVKVHLRC